MSGMELPVRAIREQVARRWISSSSSRLSDGACATHISEVLGMEVDIITLADIFVFKQRREGWHRRRGSNRPAVPRFYQELKDRVPVDMSILVTEPRTTDACGPGPNQSSGQDANPV